MIEVVNVFPVAGPIDPTQALGFDVRTDNPNTLTHVIVGIFYAGATMQEFAYAGDPSSGIGFMPLFSGSLITPVVDAGYQRFQLSISRNAPQGRPIWPDNPRLVIYAFNSAGELL